MGKTFTSDLAARSYTDEKLGLGRLKVAVMAQKAHLDAVQVRVELKLISLSHFFSHCLIQYGLCNDKKRNVNSRNSAHFPLVVSDG